MTLGLIIGALAGGCIVWMYLKGEADDAFQRGHSNGKHMVMDIMGISHTDLDKKSKEKIKK